MPAGDKATGKKYDQRTGYGHIFGLARGFAQCSRASELVAAKQCLAKHTRTARFV